MKFRCEHCQEVVDQNDVEAHAEAHYERRVGEARAALGCLSGAERAQLLQEYCRCCGWAGGKHAPKCDAA